MSALAGQTTTAGQFSGPLIRPLVAFKEDAPELAIRAALGQMKAIIEDGPTTAGFYLIDVPLDGGSVKSSEQALRALRGHAGIIRFVDLVAQ